MGDIVPLNKQNIFKYRGQSAVVRYNTKSGKYHWVTMVDLRHKCKGETTSMHDADEAVRKAIDKILDEVKDDGTADAGAEA